MWLLILAELKGRAQALRQAAIQARRSAEELDRQAETVEKWLREQEGRKENER